MAIFSATYGYHTVITIRSVTTSMLITKLFEFFKALFIIYPFSIFIRLASRAYPIFIECNAWSCIRHYAFCTIFHLFSFIIYKVKPSSTTIFCPFTYSERSDNKNNTVPEISLALSIPLFKQNSL